MFSSKNLKLANDKLKLAFVYGNPSDLRKLINESNPDRIDCENFIYAAARSSREDLEKMFIVLENKIKVVGCKDLDVEVHRNL